MAQLQDDIKNLERKRWSGLCCLPVIKNEIATDDEYSDEVKSDAKRTKNNIETVFIRNETCDDITKSVSPDFNYSTTENGDESSKYSLQLMKLISEYKKNLASNYCSFVRTFYGTNKNRSPENAIHTEKKSYDLIEQQKTNNITSKSGIKIKRNNKEKSHGTDKNQTTPKIDKLFKCDSCSSQFKRVHDLYRHKRLHSGEGVLSCENCGKKFTRARELQIHNRMHTGEKPFVCAVCGKGFMQTGDLNKHQRIHTGEKPYKCTLCGKSFTTAGNLKNHVHTHTGEKPYACSVCQLRSRDPRTIKRHIQSAHKIELSGEKDSEIIVGLPHDLSAKKMSSDL